MFRRRGREGLAMTRFLREDWAKGLLGLAVLWMGLTALLFPFRPAQLPEEGPGETYLSEVRVAYSSGESALHERYFPEGRVEAYRSEKREQWIHQRVHVHIDTFLMLPLPTCASIKPTPQLLTDPGPTLKGADKLPRLDAELLRVLARERLLDAEPDDHKEDHE